ncbi:MAG: glycoside hydrolase, partial [Abditibacteriota bacterium]|nr:glycoside hydrolase [Abditibacteriota bacterium]
MTQIYPGVWRVTFGEPEQETPVRYAFRPPLEEALNALEDRPLPSIAEALDFTVTKRGCRITAPMDPEEHIYGGGLSTRVFDKTDRRIIVRPTDRPETEEGGSHGPCPFFVSTRGYGFYLDTARYAQMYFGVTAPLDAGTDAPAEQREGFAGSAEELYARKAASRKTMLWEIPAAKGIDVYFFAGDSITDTVRRYNLFCGGGALPPLWGLGIHYRGDAAFTAGEHVRLAKSFREEGIPCDMWGLEPMWQDQTYSCSFKWNLNNYPDPAAFGKEMAGLGMHVSAWQHCFTHPSSPIYEDICKYSGDFRVWQGAVPDFTLPEARKIFQRQQIKSLYSMEGFDSVKLDECDHQPEGRAYWSFPESAVFPGGMDGEQMHSLLGPLYQQTMLEPLLEQNRRTWGLVRETHAMAAPLPYSVYSDSYTQDCFLRGLVNMGFCGQMWVPELREASSAEDLYRRIQICLLSSIMVVNCWYLKMPPWKQIATEPNREYRLMPGHEEVTRVVRE